MDLLNDTIRAGSHGDCITTTDASSDFPPHSTRICFLGRQRFIVAVVGPLPEWLNRRAALRQFSSEKPAATSVAPAAARHARPAPVLKCGARSYLLTQPI